MSTKTYHHGDLKNALIQAGIEILTQEGIQALSLRRVAKRAGVSHAAPYAHFTDKQALIAAIATEGHLRIFGTISGIVEQHPTEPLRQLVEAACAYLTFGMDEPNLFRITFSRVVEQEQDHPALVEMTRKNFDVIRQIAVRGQAAGIFGPGADDLLAVSIWGNVHGLISLLQQDQVSSAILDRHSPRQLLIFTLDQMTQTPISPDDFPASS